MTVSPTASPHPPACLRHSTRSVLTPPASICSCCGTRRTRWWSSLLCAISAPSSSRAAAVLPASAGRTRPRRPPPICPPPLQLGWHRAGSRADAAVAADRARRSSPSSRCLRSRFSLSVHAHCGCMHPGLLRLFAQADCRAATLRSCSCPVHPTVIAPSLRGGV